MVLGVFSLQGIRQCIASKVLKETGRQSAPMTKSSAERTFGLVRWIRP